MDLCLCYTQVTLIDLDYFENWCLASWGTEIRDMKMHFASDTKQLRHNIDFNNSTDQVKLRMAEIIILESCSRIGSIFSTGDDRWYIHNFVNELSCNRSGFGDRSIIPLKSALYLLTYIDYGASTPDKRDDFNHICAGGGAMVAMYLMAHLEYIFRVNGRYLNTDGTIKVSIPTQLRKKVNIMKNRVNNIDQAFTIYQYRNRTYLSKRLKLLDKRIGIKSRLRKIRHPVMHGELADPSSEAMFFGLLTAMFFYGTN